MYWLNPARLLVVCFLWPCIASAGAPQATVPRLIRFAGHFPSATAQPAGVVGATFAIYAQEEGGVPLWTEDQNVNLDANGNYRVLLGAVTNGGVPLELFAGGEARWLQVQLYVPDEVDLPRVLLVSVPYALRAGDADTLAGRPASAYLLAGSQVCAQPQTPSTPSPKPAASGLAPRATSGSSNYIARFNDTTDLGNSVLYQNNTSIGINTTNPLDVLHVAGSITAEVDGGPTSGPALDLRNAARTGFGIGAVNFYTYPNQITPSARWQASDAGGFTADQTLYTATSGNSPNQPLLPRLTVKGGAGYVGIETTNPTAPLEVNGSAKVDGNLTLSGSILSPSGNTPLIQAPNNGSNNFSAGLGALPSATGSQNTAIGYQALSANSTGNYNTATGAAALLTNTTGTLNTASGAGALRANATGSNNTATGASALSANTSGSGNTANGSSALQSNTIGNSNTASGTNALVDNTTGSSNTAAGTNALEYNTTANNNTAIGFGALSFNTVGYNNIAIGYQAGYNVSSTPNNIHIGNPGTASDAGTIRIGTAGVQTTAFIAGARGVTTGNNDAVPVMIDSNGQLGTISSSKRYKEDIHNMGAASSGLLHLRPVTFRYKRPFQDGSKPLQYGLIAEEVAKVYPALVVRSTNGQVETIKYQVLGPMLLNELQKQHATIAAQERQIRLLEKRLAKLEHRRTN